MTKREAKIEQICWRLARHLLNPDNIPLYTWGRIGLDILHELQDLNPKKYAKVMQVRKESEN